MSGEFFAHWLAQLRNVRQRRHAKERQLDELQVGILTTCPGICILLADEVSLAICTLCLAETGHLPVCGVALHLPSGCHSRKQGSGEQWGRGCIKAGDCVQANARVSLRQSACIWTGSTVVGSSCADHPRGRLSPAGAYLRATARRAPQLHVRPGLQTCKRCVAQAASCLRNCRLP